MADLTNLKLTLNIDELTLDEIDVVEEITNAPIQDLFDPEKVRPGKRMKALALVAARRRDPSVTLEDVGKLTVNDLMVEHGADPKDEQGSESAS